MGIFGGLFRGVKGKPPEIPPGASVQLESVPTPGIFGGTLPQRPYWVMLDADHQEVGERHYFPREPAFTDLDYAGRWCQWVQAQGARPQPDYPAGGV
jgi:hypothetical protein